MNILFVAVGSIVSQNGYITRIIDEARILSSHKTSLIFFVPISEYINFKVLKKSSPIIKILMSTFESVHVYPTMKYVHLSIFKGFFLRRFISQNKVEILYAESTAAGYILSKIRTDIPYILDLHGFSEYETILRSKAKRRGKLASFLARKISQDLDKNSILDSNKVVAVSERMRMHLGDKYNYPLKNITVLQCYPRKICANEKIIGWKQNRKLIRDELGIQKNTTVLGYLGGMGTYQMIDTIINFFKDYQRHNNNSLLLMIVVGDLSMLNKLIEESKLKNKIIILNNIPYSNVCDYLSSIDFGIIFREQDPVNYYASPTKFGEYVSAGVPLLVSKNIGDFNKLILNNNLGIIVNKNISADKKLVKSMARYNLNRENSAKKIISWADNEYNWDVMKKDFNKLFY